MEFLKSLTRIIVLGFAAVSTLARAEQALETLQLENPQYSRFERFQELYKPFFGNGNDLMSKIVDNRGNGYDPLYGVRNLRVVLHGVMYRGGANNAFHRDTPRDNMNPLPADGLQNLCKESFGQAIYLYDKNYRPAEVSCTSRTGSDNLLTYSQISVLNSAVGGFMARGAEAKEILGRAYKCATGLGQCPIYTHCWNGWHASGYISAVALRQFCDFTAEQAVQYWIDGTDSVANSNYPTIKTAIKEFTPYPEFQISSEIKSKICPQNIYVHN
jgi:hypothetical protein